MRHFVAVLVGIISAIVGLIVIIFLLPEGRLFSLYFPLFYGSLLAGYIAKKYGWLIGFIIAILFLFLFFLFFFAIVHRSATISEALFAWGHSWWSFICAIILSITGGYIGSYLSSLIKGKRS